MKKLWFKILSWFKKPVPAPDATLALAKRFEAMHAACKSRRNYIKKMQPYFIVLKKYMNEHNCDPIAACLATVNNKTSKHDIIWYYGTAAEMLDNLK